MKIYILDASVVLSFLLDENLSIKKKLLTILKQAETGKLRLISFYLLPLEVGNGLRYSLADKKLAQEALEKFLNLPLDYFVFRPAHYSRILQLAYFSGTSFYDTAYHFLAQLLRGTFLTADAAYFKKARNLGSVKLL